MKEEEVDVNDFLERLMTPERLRKQSVSTVQSKSTSLLNGTSYSSVGGTPSQPVAEDTNLSVRLEDFGGLFDDLGGGGLGGDYSSAATTVELGTLLHPKTLTKNTTNPSVIRGSKRSMGVVIDEEIMLDARQMFKPLSISSRRVVKRRLADYSKPFDADIWELFYPSLPPTPNKTPTAAKSVVMAGNFVLNRPSESISAESFHYSPANNDFYNNDNDNNENEFSVSPKSDDLRERLIGGKSFWQVCKRGVDGRKLVSRAFQKLLELANTNMVQVSQSASYADISISRP